MTKLTHSQLVKIARRWLENERCRVVVSELATIISETPDVAGWKGSGYCIVVECKMSRADLKANEKKPHERAGCALGDERWFLVPQGLIAENEVPDGWGLMEYRKSKLLQGGYCKKIVRAPTRDKSDGSNLQEKRMLISATWRALKALELVRPLSLGVDSDEKESGE